MPKPEKTAQEQPSVPAVQTDRERRAAMVPTFKGNRLEITPEQREHMLDAFKTDHGELLRHTLQTAISGASNLEGDAGQDVMNTALRLLVELQPTNALERMLVAQYVACDRAASQCLNIGFNTENDGDARRKYLNIGLQFQNLLVRQVEALAKLRTGGQQHVTVEHVHVHQGGQAIVGAVTQSPAGGGVAGGGR